jgi:soluble lytic murein transglycosylase-like protein
MLKTGAIAIALAAVLSTSAPAFGGPGAARTVGRDAMFSAAGSIYGLDPALLKAIAAVESDGRSDAVSSAGAMGLMQLMPATAARFGITDPFDPVQSVLGAARFLSYLRRESQTGGELPDLLAAYNAGPGAVERFGGIPPYPETQQYVRRVLWLYLLDMPSPAAAGQNRYSIADLPNRHISARRTPRHGDWAVLGQLADLRRMREAAAAAARARPR